MSQITQLASGAITAADTITVELIEADETPAVVIVRWPVKPTVLHPRRFPDTAAMVARLFAEAPTALAAIKAVGGSEQHTQKGEGPCKLMRAATLSLWRHLGTWLKPWEPGSPG
jgi:hypothetical protein